MLCILVLFYSIYITYSTEPTLEGKTKDYIYVMIKNKHPWFWIFNEDAAKIESITGPSPSNSFSCLKMQNGDVHLGTFKVKSGLAAMQKGEHRYIHILLSLASQVFDSMGRILSMNWPVRIKLPRGKEEMFKWKSKSNILTCYFTNYTTANIFIKSISLKRSQEFE